MLEKKECCTARYHEIEKKDLPLCCPTRDMRLWDGHPRVYLPITATGRAVCPYCETHYILKDFVAPAVSPIT